MDDVVAEEVARQRDRHGQLTQANTSFWERDRPGRHGARLATRSEKKDGGRDVFGQTPNTAPQTTALPTARISVPSRLLASIGGLTRQFLIFPHSLTQLVDFHVYFGYFHLA